MAARVAHHKARYATLAGAGGGALLLGLLIAGPKVVRALGRWDHESTARAIGAAIKQAPIEIDGDDRFQLLDLRWQVESTEGREIRVRYFVDFENLSPDETLAPKVRVYLSNPSATRVLAFASADADDVAPGRVGSVAALTQDLSSIRTGEIAHLELRFDLR